MDVYADAKCWAAAVASALTATETEVACSGKKAYGCGDGNAKARAIACSVAKAVVDINVKLNYKQAECDAKISSAISAIAEAVAESHSRACSKNGYVGHDKDVDLAFGLQKVAADVFASCWVYCDGQGVVKSVVKGDANANVVKSEILEAGDSAHAASRSKHH